MDALPVFDRVAGHFRCVLGLGRSQGSYDRCFNFINYPITPSLYTIQAFYQCPCVPSVESGFSLVSNVVRLSCVFGICASPIRPLLKSVESRQVNNS